MSDHQTASTPAGPAGPAGQTPAKDDELDSARARVAERFATSAPPEVLSRLPREIVRDAALNLARGLDGDASLLARGDRLLIGLGVAEALGSARLASWLDEAAKVAGKNDADRSAARAVGITCSTYNGYYKFRSLWHGHEFDTFQPALRATPFVKSPLTKALVELICIAVSVENNCSHCVNGHVQAARGAGATDAAIDETVRAGAVVGALAKFAREG